MSSVTGLERVQWCIEGQRFEATVGFLMGESTFFEEAFERFDGVASSSLFDPESKLSPEFCDASLETLPDGKKFFKFVFSERSQLKAEWMGNIVVYLRRGRMTWEWESMEADQQESFGALVRFFGFNKLMEKYSKASKGVTPPSLAAGVVERENVDNKKSESAETCGDAETFAQRLAQAQMALEQHRSENENKETAALETSDTPPSGSSTAMASANVVRPIHPSVDDDGLHLPTAGCYYCGSAGDHSSEECPRKPQPR